MKSLTIEQVLAKRKQVIVDMCDGLMLEVRASLAATGVAAEVVEQLQLKKSLDSVVLKHKPQHYNVDKNFVKAVRQAFEVKKVGLRFLDDVQKAVELLSSKDTPQGHNSYWPRIEALQLLGTSVTMLEQHVGVVISNLAFPQDIVRDEARQTLAKLQAASLARHAVAISELLDASDGEVCKSAMHVLSSLGPAVLAVHADAVVAKLNDPREGEATRERGSVREVAIKTLAQLEPA